VLGQLPANQRLAAALEAQAHFKRQGDLEAVLALKAWLEPAQPSTPPLRPA
jgi:hypothetical protein